MAASKYDSNSADVNWPDHAVWGDLLSVKALKRAQRFVREIEELEYNRQYLLGSDARAGVRLSIIGAPDPSYEMPGRGVITLRRPALIGLLEDEIAERQQELLAMGVEAPAIGERPARWNESYNVNRVVEGLPSGDAAVSAADGMTGSPPMAPVRDCAK
jgi:hypothetical protein